MKRNLFIFGLLLLILGVFLVGCLDEEDPNPNDNVTPAISLEKNSYQLEMGEAALIEATVSEGFELLFSSQNPDVATVDSTGLIETLEIGEATIVVYVKDHEDVMKNIAVTVTGTIVPNILTLTGPDSIYIGETVAYTANDPNSGQILWESLTPSVLKIDQNGNVTGLSEGDGKIRIYSELGEILEKEITVLIPDPESVEIREVTKRVTYAGVKLLADVYPQGAKQDVVWASGDENVCMIDERGSITVIMPGEVLITATVPGTDLTARITLLIEPTLLEVLEHYNNENPVVQNIRVYGYESSLPYRETEWDAYYWNYDLYGSVNNYLNMDLNIVESLLGATKNNRPGKTSEKIYITVHDTGSAATSAGAQAHNSYIHSSGAENSPVSWHYTVGNDGIFHHIPDDEWAYHAGDGTGIPYALYDSGIPYTNQKKPVVTIHPSGYYALDGEISNVLVPKKPNGTIPSTSEINDLGIEVLKGDNGNWEIGETWWSNSFGYVSNRGGNRNSIGIESCVNQGSDVFLTWQLLAKLVAKLMEENNLGIDRIVQHHYFSGKDCPMTMRNSHNFEMFLKLVEAEYTIRTLFKDYTISFQSNSPYFDNRGRITSLPLVETRATYSATITNTKTGNVETKLYYVNLPIKG